MADVGTLGGSIVNYLYGLAGSGIFWASLVIAGMFAVFLGLRWKKSRRFVQPIIKCYDLGNKKIGMSLTHGGYFKKDRMLFGLWESGGEEELLTKEEEVVYGSTSSDYHEFNGVRTLFVMANPDDPKMLFPLSKIEFTERSKAAMLDIAPIEVREAAVDAFIKTTKEMKDLREQIVQWVIIGLFFIVAFLVILFITQYGKHTLDTAAQMNAAAEAHTEKLATIVSDALNKFAAAKSPVAP